MKGLWMKVDFDFFHTPFLDWIYSTTIPWISDFSNQIQQRLGLGLSCIFGVKQISHALCGCLSNAVYGIEGYLKEWVLFFFFWFLFNVL